MAFSFMRLDRFRGLFEPLRAAHPWLGPDGFDPIGEGRDETEVLDDVLLADPAGRDDPAGGQGDGCAEDRFRHEDALGVMPQGAVPEIGDDLLGLVEPVVDTLIISDFAAPFLYAGERMVIRMRHDALPQNV
jgi:hypothetical protein